MAETIDEVLKDEFVKRQAFREAYRRAADGACSWASIYSSWDEYQAAIRAIPADKIPAGHPIDDWSGIPGEPLRTIPYQRLRER